MPPDRPRTPRTLLIPDHLWDAFATMASEMGTDRAQGYHFARPLPPSQLVVWCQGHRGPAELPRAA